MVVNPFDFVSVPNALGTVTVGMVKELEAVGSDAWTQQNDKTASRVLARVLTLANTGFEDKFSREIPVEMPVGIGSPVRFAKESEILFALGIPKMNNPIPLGIIEMSNGLQVPVSLDVSYLLGPDTAHINAAGISGNNKTTYLLFLLQATFQKLNENGTDVAVIMFNTKEEDLLHIHEKNRVKSKHKKDFSVLGLDLEPFDNVTYFLPRGSDGRPNSAFVPRQSKTYSFELRDIYDKLELLFIENNQDSPVASILNYIYESWPLESGSGKVTSWSDLTGFREYPPEIVSHKSTLFSFLGNLQRIRKSPLFIDNKSSSVYLGNKIKTIRAGEILVIDIARVPTLSHQAFIVGDVMKCIDELYSYNRAAHKVPKAMHSAKKGRDNFAPKFILVFIDELNRFVPRFASGVHMSPVVEQIVRTVITGRSRGTVLFSAQQFKSTVSPVIHENTGLHVTAKVGLPELHYEPYATIDENTRMSITRLNKGEMVLIHPTFRQPIRIVFPKTPLKI